MVLTRRILGMFAWNTVILYHLIYTIKLMMIIQGTIELRYNIRSAWFLDIRISTCLFLLNVFIVCMAPTVNAYFIV